MKKIKRRLEYLRKELRAERISQEELLELQSLKGYIEKGDVELLQAVGVPEVSPRLNEAFKQVQEAMIAIFGYCKDWKNKRKWIPKVSVELVVDGDDHSILVDGWLYIMDSTQDVTKDMTLGKAKRTVPCWALSYVVHDPGVRYHKDGSGTPPSDDLFDCNPPTTTGIYHAVEVLSNMIVKNHCNALAEYALEKQQSEAESRLEH